MSERQKRITIPKLLAMKANGEPISMVTAYDTPSARLADAAELDVILVGDSVGDNVLGYPTTVPVTMEEMLHHTKAVRRGVSRALLIGDMPFLSFNISDAEAIENAGRFLKEGGVEAVKLEGGEEMAERVRAIVRAGIPVMGHIGYTPQRTSQLGGPSIQGKDEARARKILNDATALEEAGAFALILEVMPWQLAQLVSERVSIPTIGIGAGPHCDGQVLVFHDLLGLTVTLPKHAKRYLELHRMIGEALRAYHEDVKTGAFPTAEEHSFSMSSDVVERLQHGSD